MARLRAFREPTLDSSRMSVRFSFQGPRHPGLPVCVGVANSTYFAVRVNLFLFADSLFRFTLPLSGRRNTTKLLFGSHLLVNCSIEADRLWTRPSVPLAETFSTVPATLYRILCALPTNSLYQLSAAIACSASVPARWRPLCFAASFPSSTWHRFISVPSLGRNDSAPQGSASSTHREVSPRVSPHVKGSRRVADFARDIHDIAMNRLV